MQEGGTYIIPGHGRLTDEADLLEYRDMVTIIRDRVQDGVKRGQTLDQVKAGKPTLDYDARWGATSGFWTTDMFIEAVYKDLKAASPPSHGGEGAGQEEVQVAKACNVSTEDMMKRTLLCD